jgi:hypothetical protein
MVELISEGKAPRSLVRRAARGELSLPSIEAIEILVALTVDPELGAEAERTLAAWDEAVVSEIAAGPATPVEVLRHLLRSHVQNPEVIVALCDNPALPLAELEALATHGPESALRAMIHSERICSSSRILELLNQNPLAEPMAPLLAELISTVPGDEEEQEIKAHLARHAEEIAREDAQPFELVSAFDGEDDPLAQLLEQSKQGKAPAAPEEQEQLSILQKIGRLTVGERIKLAMRGSREERMILIRDRSKLVSLAVLVSPKVNDSEMESFAAMKNIQESVLRAIATNRKNMKNYGVIRTLVNNPKAPIDISLPLLAHLLIKDLRGVAVNKNVNETLRKRATRMFRLKTERKE